MNRDVSKRIKIREYKSITEPTSLHIRVIGRIISVIYHKWTRGVCINWLILLDYTLDIYTETYLKTLGARHVGNCSAGVNVISDFFLSRSETWTRRTSEFPATFFASIARRIEWFRVLLSAIITNAKSDVCGIIRTVVLIQKRPCIIQELPIFKSRDRVLYIELGEKLHNECWNCYNRKSRDNFFWLRNISKIY